MPAPQFLIVYPQTTGNEHDARVLADALQKSFSTATVTFLHLGPQFNHDYRSPLGSLCPTAPKTGFDVVFMIELARLNSPFLDPGFAKRLVYVPHIEWLNEADEASLSLGVFDMLLAKNELTKTIVRTLPAAAGVRHIPVTGWTSRDVGLGEGPWAPERFDRFLHVRGVSHAKQTDIVLETWRQHPEWPHLLVSCYVNDPLSFEEPLTYGSNVTVILRRQEEDEITFQARHHGVHVIPSLTESYGHVLNEARAVGALLVTTDAPPMSNLVRHSETGVLVATSPDSAVPHFRSYGHPVTREALEDAVQTVLSMSLTARAEMGKAARSAYETERAKFIQSIAALQL